MPDKDTSGKYAQTGMGVKEGGCVIAEGGRE